MPLKSILVIGCTQGVGKHTLLKLIEKKQNHLKNNNNNNNDDADSFTIHALVRPNSVSKFHNLMKENHIENFEDFVELREGDITQPETLTSALSGINVVIFCASASRGWTAPSNPQNPKNVDYYGSRNVIDACQSSGDVSKFILVSSCGVTRPFWFVSLMLNTLFGNVIKWKCQSEEYLRQELSSQNYTIVRPGGLYNEAGGQKPIQIMQGDNSSGRISREDVGALCAFIATDHDASEKTKNVSLECINNQNEQGKTDFNTLFTNLKQD